MRNFDEILAKIARDNGTTPEDVLHEMQVAIDNAYDHHDQEAQQLWDKMTFKGDRPTPEEFIFQVAMMLDEGNVILTQLELSSPMGAEVLPSTAAPAAR